MARAKYFLTQTASNQYRIIILDTAQKFGIAQAHNYRALLRDGFAKIASGELVKSPYREEMALGFDFSIEHIGHHYVVYCFVDADKLIIAAIFHERMDIPTRLKELQSKSKAEIERLRNLLTK